MNRHERRAAARLGRGGNATGWPPSGDPFAAAVQLFQQGRNAEAERACAQALRLDPHHPGALHMLGVIHLQAGSPQRALELITQAIALDPRPHTFHNNQGSALRALERHTEAEASFRRALAIKPDYVRALTNLGCTLSAADKPQDAIVYLRRALALAPNDLEACMNLAQALYRQGAFEEAASHYEHAARLAPQAAEIYQNLGGVRLLQGRTTEAIEFFRRAAQLGPDNVHVWLMLAAALEKELRLTAAVQAYEEAIRCEPARAETHNALGNLLASLGRLDQAVTSYRRAIQLAPDKLSLRSNLIMTLHSLPAVSASDILAEARAFDTQTRLGMTDTRPLRRSPQDAERRPLRVGYVSADFRIHPVGFFLERVLPAHDSNAFEIFLYSDVQFPDEQTERLRASVKNYHSTVEQTDLQLIDLIAADGIDILVDLAGHTGSNRLGVFARRAAPLHVSWLGYFGSTGLTAMDFVIADEHVAPPGDEASFTEALYRIAHPYLCWSPPAAEIPVQPFPAFERGHVTFGSFNNRAKLNQETLAAWARILRGADNSRLLLKSWAFGDAGCREAVITTFTTQGIASDRLIFEGLSSRELGLAAYNQIDIALDPFPFGGCTTTADTLWMGVPLVTQAGARWSGRMSQSILSCLGLQEWVARDTDEYVGLAVRMAGRLAELAPLREQLRRRLEQSPFCDGKHFTRRLEDAYRAMWRSAR